MAVMTYAEMKQKGLVHGEKWCGKIVNYFRGIPEATYLLKVDLLSGYIRDVKYLDDNFSTVDEYHLFGFIAGISIGDIPDYMVFADTKEELISYCRRAPKLRTRRKNEPTLGYKLVQIDDTTYGLCTLEIPKKARCTNPYFGRKCRADRVKVLSIRVITEDGYLGKSVQSGYSALYTRNRMMYHVGEYLEAAYNPSRLVECTQGIHFYMTIGEVLELYKAVLRNEK